MTSVNFPRDDANVVNPKTVSKKAVEPLQPYPTVQPTQKEKDTPTEPKTQQRHIAKERRKGNRREKKQNVILDTRSHHERRNATTKTIPEEGEPAAENKAGIDTYT